MSITPQTAAAAREARRHLAAAKADIARAESILEASDVGRFNVAQNLAHIVAISAANAAMAIDAAIGARSDGLSPSSDSGPGDNDTATDKPPPRRNEVGP